MRMSCDAGAGRERVHGRVEPPRLRRRSRTAARPRARTPSGARGRTSAPAAPAAAPARRDVLHERRLVLLHVLEQRPHLGARHAALVVVEHARRTARRSRRRSTRRSGGAARGCAAGRAGTPRSRSRSRASTQPWRPSDAGARHLGAQVGRHLARLLPVAAHDADQARLERVGLVLLLEPGQLVEQAADLGRRELLVRDAAERRRAARRGRPRRAAASSSAGPSARIAAARPRSLISARRRPQLVEFRAHGGAT